MSDEKKRAEAARKELAKRGVNVSSSATAKEMESIIARRNKRYGEGK